MIRALERLKKLSSGGGPPTDKGGARRLRLASEFVPGPRPAGCERLACRGLRLLLRHCCCLPSEGLVCVAQHSMLTLQLRVCLLRCREPRACH